MRQWRSKRPMRLDDGVRAGNVECREQGGARDWNKRSVFAGALYAGSGEGQRISLKLLRLAIIERSGRNRLKFPHSPFPTGETTLFQGPNVSSVRFSRRFLLRILRLPVTAEVRIEQTHLPCGKRFGNTNSTTHLTKPLFVASARPKDRKELVFKDRAIRTWPHEANPVPCAYPCRSIRNYITTGMIPRHIAMKINELGGVYKCRANKQSTRPTGLCIVPLSFMPSCPISALSRSVRIPQKRNN